MVLEKPLSEKFSLQPNMTQVHRFYIKKKKIVKKIKKMIQTRVLGHIKKKR